MQESKVYVFDKNCKHCRDREGHIAKANTLNTKYRVRCEGCGHIHYVKKDLFEDMMEQRGDKPIEPPAKRIEEYGSVVSSTGHNLPINTIKTMMKVAVTEFVEAMEGYEHSLFQKVELEVKEVMQPDILEPDIDIPYTLVSWKTAVEVDND